MSEHIIQDSINAVLELSEMKSVQDVREWARARGASGHTGSDDECVLANAIRCGHDDVGVTVTGDEITLNGAGLVIKFEVTDDIYAFIDSFDNNEYPELVNDDELFVIIDEMMVWPSHIDLQFKQVMTINNKQEVLANVR